MRRVTVTGVVACMPRVRRHCSELRGVLRGERRSWVDRVGLFSGGTITTNDVNNTSGFREKVKVVFASCGSRENAAGIKANHEALNSIGLKNTAYVSPDTAHEFLTWRRSLYQFAPVLFRD